MDPLAKSIMYAIIFFTILLGLYTIYDHQEKYFGREPIRACKNIKTVGSRRDRFAIVAPTLGTIDDSSISFGEGIFNETANIDEMLESTISKHFGDIKSSKYEVLDVYKKLTDENSLFDLRSSLRSLLAKSKVIRDLHELHKELQKAKLQATCQPINITEINSMYTNIEPKIKTLKDLEADIQRLHDAELEFNNKAYTSLTEKEWEKSKEQANLTFLKQQLDSDGPRKKLTYKEQEFLRTFSDVEARLLREIAELQRQQNELNIAPSEARHWKQQSIRRAREVIRLQIKDLPLTHKINDLKDDIQDLENVDRKSSEIVSEFQKGREQLEEAVKFKMLDQKEADRMYELRLKGYLDAIKQLVKLKYYAFKKDKVRHSTEELEKEDLKLESISKYIRLAEEIEAKNQQLRQLRSTYSELHSLQDNDIEITKDQLRLRIKTTQDRIAQLQSDINAIKATAPQFDRDTLNAKIAQAEKLRGEIEPEYQVYMRRVDSASKYLNDCKIDRIKLEGKIEDIKHRIQDATSRLSSYNENIHSIVSLLDDKVPDIIPAAK